MPEAKTPEEVSAWLDKANPAQMIGAAALAIILGSTSLSEDQRADIIQTALKAYALARIAEAVETMVDAPADLKLSAQVMMCLTREKALKHLRQLILLAEMLPKEED